jgi:hypothetical protein
MGNRLVIDALIETEEATLFFEPFIVAIIDDPYDPSYNFAILPCQERFASIHLVKRMLAKTNELLLVHPNRWYPVRIILVKPPDQFHELLAITPCLNWGYFYLTHGNSISVNR